MVIAVTGSTGHIGSELVRLLSGAGALTRAVFRNADRTWSAPYVAWLRADLRDPRLLDATFGGTDRLFLLTDNAPDFGDLQVTILEAARRAGVQYIVKVSALGASDHSNSGIAREHWKVEQVLQKMNIAWTILRPHSFMQNWLADVAETVRTQSRIYSSIGDAVVPFIDTRDIAAVAAQALLHPESHVGTKYVLTGGEAVGFADLARVLSAVTGRVITYVPITMDEARRRMDASGMTAPLRDAMLAIQEYQRAGGPTAKVSPHLERILGRPPRTIADFARDCARSFI